MKRKPHVFGPVPSRRLGLSLGVDLVPHKTCTLDCIYCQVGATTNLTLTRKEWVPLDEVISDLHHRLGEVQPDVVTFSGLGEPTLHSVPYRCSRSFGPKAGSRFGKEDSITTGKPGPEDSMRRRRTGVAVAILAFGLVVFQAFPAQGQGKTEYVDELLDFGIELRADSKYAQTAWFQEFAGRLVGVRRAAVTKINRLTGLAYEDRYTIVLRFLDQNEEGARKFKNLHAQRVTVRRGGGEVQLIRFFMEYFKNGQADLPKKVIHEMVHGVMRESMSRTEYLRIPKWVREGTAVYLAGQEEARIRHILSLYAEGNPFSVVKDLGARHSSVDYARDALLFHYMVKRYGHDKFRSFMNLLVRKKLAPPVAIEKALGIPFARFRKEGLAFAIDAVSRLAAQGDVDYKAAFQLYRLRLFDRAVSALEAIIKHRPTTYAASGASYYLAKCHYYRREYEKAKAGFQLHIRNYSGMSGLVDDAKFYIGISCYEQGNFAGCAKAMAELRRDYPYSGTVLSKGRYYRALSLGKLDRNKEAQEVLTEMLRLYPDTAFAPKARSLLAALQETK
jgi:TolA-binding protein